MRALLLLATIAVGTCLVSACGGGGSESCGSTSACGGNIVGNWQIAESCLSAPKATMMSGLGAVCSSATVDVSGLMMTGTMSFKEDKTFTTSLTYTGSVAISVPASCLTTGGVTLTCDQLGQALQGTADAAAQPVPACKAGSGGGCTCTMATPRQASMGSGTYSTSGNTLSQIDASGGAATLTDYCVKNDKLSMILKPTMTTGSTNMTGTVDLTGEVVLDKK